jgi:hypothetical protein
MDKEILMRNIVYLNDKGQKLQQLKKAQIRHIASTLCEKLSGWPSYDRDDLNVLLPYEQSDPDFGIELCREVTRQMPTMTPDSFYPSHDGTESTYTVSYVKNAHSTQAFNRFASRIKTATPRTATAYASCCEDVATGESDACILPLYTGKDGILPSFCALAEEHELAVHSIFRVEMPHTEDFTLFGLMRPQCEYTKGVHYLAFAIHEELLGRFGTVLSALKAYGATPVKLGTVSLGKEFGGFLTLCVADVLNANLSALLLYLDLFFPSYIAFGFFNLLE